MRSSGIPYIDLIIVIALLFFIYKGYQKGFTVETTRIIGTLASLLLAIKFMSDISREIIASADIPPIVAIIFSFTLIFVSSFFILKYISDKLVKAVKLSIALGGADKIIGGALGLFKGTIIVSLCTIFISLFDFMPFVKKHISDSQLFNPMRQVAPLVYDAFKVFVPQSRPFIEELQESLSGVSVYRRGESTDRLIEYYQKKQNN